jgi:endonuclease YncB( thermonuclease family)
MLPRLLAALVLAASSVAPACAAEWTGVVVGVADGDTLTLLDNRKTQHRIRLDGIDAPERKQPFGQRSRQSLTELAKGRHATADCPKTDRYGRAVCRVRIDGVDVGLAQLERGLAWHYLKYAHELDPPVRVRYERAEREARMGRAGLWSQPQPTPPWDYRHPPREIERAG